MFTQNYWEWLCLKLTFSLCSDIRYRGIQLMDSIAIFGTITSDLVTSIIHPWNLYTVYIIWIYIYIDKPTTRWFHGKPLRFFSCSAYQKSLEAKPSKGGWIRSHFGCSTRALGTPHATRGTGFNHRRGVGPWDCCCGCLFWKAEKKGAWKNDNFVEV